MSGHSKWSTIKHKKAAIDAKRGQAFTKLIKEITVAARLGGGDQNGNPRLRLLLDKAKDLNMPTENTMRAIKKGTGELPGQSYEEFTYEGYGPYGIAVIVDTLTDNKNRTVSELRHLFSSKGGTLSEAGSVNWMFEKLGVIRAQGENISEEKLLEELLEYDINDIKNDQASFAVFCPLKSLDAIKHKLEELGMKIESAELEWVAKTTTTLPEDQASKAYEFLEALDDHEDIKNVYTNLVD
jgi:YebC/PmpR family DNA-binding regulatory protein